MLYKKISEYIYEIPLTTKKGMLVPARFFASERIFEKVKDDRSLEQLLHMTFIPGIYKYALAMPDMHEGYGFPIGGVAATEKPDGLISPGGIGYDINCGVRLLKTHFGIGEIKEHMPALATELYRLIPSGVGRGGMLRLSKSDVDKVLISGAAQMAQWGYGSGDDLRMIESYGCLIGADPSTVSDKAKKRGAAHIGTLGAGNHFVEVQKVETVFVPEIAEKFGLFKDQVVVMMHTGSRGLGHQNCADYLRLMGRAMGKYKISLPDSKLAGVPFSSPEGQDYFSSMKASANFAFANRQMITYLVRQAFNTVLSPLLGEIKLLVLYDVAHNIAKEETYNGKELIVHRKGATRAFGPDNKELDEKYRDIGQPVLIPGSMGTASYVLVGTKESADLSFGTTCHGAGREMSRSQAKKTVQGERLRRELQDRGIEIRAQSERGLAEEAPCAYKDVDEVVEVVDKAGIAKKVARLTPLAVIKG